MGLTTWKDAPDGKIQKFDVVVAKNYLTKEELSAMARIVNAYLDLAELRAEEEVPMTMEDWAEQFEGVLRLRKKRNSYQCRKYFCKNCRTARSQ